MHINVLCTRILDIHIDLYCVPVCVDMMLSDVVGTSQMPRHRKCLYQLLFTNLCIPIWCLHASILLSWRLDQIVSVERDLLCKRLNLMMCYYRLMPVHEKCWSCKCRVCGANSQESGHFTSIPMFFPLEMLIFWCFQQCNCYSWGFNQGHFWIQIDPIKAFNLNKWPVGRWYCCLCWQPTMCCQPLLWSATTGNGLNQRAAGDCHGPTVF